MPRSGGKQAPHWKRRWISWRNSVLSDPRFQQWAARNRLTRPFARRKASELFDLVAGFTYTQTLLAMVESGLLDRLVRGECGASEAAQIAGLSEDAAQRLLRAAASLKLTEEISPGFWMLGERGASLLPQAGAQAMIRHHALLYRDLSDPLGLLRQDRAQPTELSEFWRYAARADAQAESAAAVTPYSQLMATSQTMVSQEVLRAYNFGQHAALLDVGGGHGAFVGALANRHPQLRLGIFDLPSVLESARERLAPNIECHSGDFFRAPLPRGFDCITLVRILHDHDDPAAQLLLAATRAALPAGGRLVIAEPMAATRGAEAMGEAYFGLYLLAMRSGRPRTHSEIGNMLKTAGFRGFKRLRTDQPLITSAIVAFA